MCLAVPGEVLEVFEGSSELERRARVRFGGVVREVSLALHRGILKRNLIEALKAEILKHIPAQLKDGMRGKVVGWR